MKNFQEDTESDLVAKKQGCGYVSKSQDHLLSENFSRRKEMWFCGEVGDHLLTNL